MNDRQLSDLFVKGIEEKHGGDRALGEEMLERWKLETKRKKRADTLLATLVILCGLAVLIAVFVTAPL